jgi:hypothetical protein
MCYTKQVMARRAIIALFVLCAVVAGSIAHEHDVGAEKDRCAACAIGSTPAAPPTPPAIAAPPLFVRVVELSPPEQPTATPCLEFAPKTSPPSLIAV